MSPHPTTHTDHLIPWDAAYRTTQVLGGDSTFVLSNGGHIQAILNPPDNPKAAYLVSETLPPTAVEWRERATHVAGSWWSAWHEWLAARSGQTVRARKRLGNAAQRFQTIAYDASGTGNSPARLVPLRPSGLARQAAHLLDALGQPTVDVLGVSFGGGVAQELTLRNPHRVRRLVLAQTTCGLGGVPRSPLAIAVLATPLRYYSPTFLRATARWVYGPVHEGDGTLMRRQIVARRSRPPTLWGYLSQLYAVTGWTSLPWLHRITAPTLVLSGANDPVVPPINARILGARIPNASVHVVPDTGHLLLMERAAQCAALIAQFLRQDP